MTTTVLKRQIIRDAEDNPIAVILPIDEFALVEDLLDQRISSQGRRRQARQNETGSSTIRFSWPDLT